MKSLVLALALAGAAVPPFPAAGTSSPSGAARASGGVNYMCVLLGLATGAQIGMGNYLGAGITLISAWEHGCL